MTARRDPDWIEHMNLQPNALRKKTRTRSGRNITEAAEAKTAAKARKTGDTKTLREIELAQELGRLRTARQQRAKSGRFAPQKRGK